jgi:hypothetical protein
MEGSGLLYSKGYDRIAALNSCKLKHPPKLLHPSIGQLLMLDQERDCESSPDWVRREFLVETLACKVNGKTGTAINKCFDKNFQQCHTQ